GPGGPPAQWPDPGRRRRGQPEPAEPGPAEHGRAGVAPARGDAGAGHGDEVAGQDATAAAAGGTALGRQPAEGGVRQVAGPRAGAGLLQSPSRGAAKRPWGNHMARLLGILLIVLVLYGTLVGSFDTARSVDNHVDLARRLGFYGVLTLGVGTLIITGGIDLSI